MRTNVKLTYAAPTNFGVPQYTLPMPESALEDAAGNVTFEFTEPMWDVRTELKKYVSSQVEQYRTRAGTYVCVADRVFVPNIEPPAALLLVEWKEILPHEPVNRTRNRSLTGVLVMSGHRNSRRETGLTLVVYRADRVVVRNSFLVYP